MAGSRRNVGGKENRAHTPKKAPGSKKRQGKSVGDRLVVVFFGCYDREIGFTCLARPFDLYLDLAYLIDPIPTSYV